MVTKEDIENVSKPSKTMYYAIYVDQPDQSQQILCVSPSIYITSEDLEKYGITRHDVMTINRLIAYQQGILGMSTKYKNGAEQKRAESILTDMGIPYSKYILPIDKKGNECCDGDEIYLPDGFWNEAWGLYVELYHPQN